MPEPRCEYTWPDGNRCQKPPHEGSEHWWNSVDEGPRPEVRLREALRNVIAYAEARLPSDDPGWQSIRAIARAALGDDADETGR